MANISSMIRKGTDYAASRAFEAGIISKGLYAALTDGEITIADALRAKVAVTAAKLRGKNKGDVAGDVMEAVELQRAWQDQDRFECPKD